MIKRLIPFLLLGLFTGPALADEWTGLWRVQRFFEGRLDGTYHVRFTDDATDRVTVYDHEARPMYVQAVQFEGDNLELVVANSPIQPLPLQLRLTRMAGELSGDWLFSQFQFDEPLQGRAVGFRVTAAPQWDPWAEVEKHRSTQVIDLTDFLRKNAPLKNFKHFEDFWAERVEAPYYFLVEPWLYGDAVDPIMARREILRSVFDSLSKPGRGRDFAEKFPEWADRALEMALKARSGGFRGFLVSLPQPRRHSVQRFWTRVPTPEEEASCACKIDLREAFLFFNPTAFAQEEAGAARLLTNMVRETAWEGLSPSIAVEVFRQSLALKLGLGILGQPGPSVDAAMATILKGMMRDRLLAASEGFSASAEERLLAESLAVGLGADFLAWMTKKHGDKDLPALDSRDVMQGWIVYLGGPTEAAKVRAPRP